MPAYMIFMREGPIFNQAAMDKYSDMNRAEAGISVQRYKVQPRVVYGAMETFEGEAPDGIVMLEFPTMDDARAWYNSPEYQAAVLHRKEGANYRAILVEGL